MVQRTNITRAVAHQRQRFFADAGEYELAICPVWHRLKRIRIDDLWIEIILTHMQPRLHPAFIGNARACNFGESVDIIRLNSQGFFDLAAHVFRPWLRTKQTRAQWKRCGINPHTVDRLPDKHCIGGRAAQKIGAEILQNLHLAFGVAGGDRDRGSAHLLRAVVEPQTARK